MAIEIVDFPINSMVDLSIAMLVHQRVIGRLRYVNYGFMVDISTVNEDSKSAYNLGAYDSGFSQKKHWICPKAKGP